MKAKILAVVFFFSIVLFGLSNLTAGSGILLEYEVDGTAVGGTTLLGNLKVLLQNNMKRMTGNLFYDEPGAPYPTLDEKDLIVNFAEKKKYLKTTDSGTWGDESLSDDYSMIKDNELSITIKPGANASVVIAVVKVSLPADFGGEKVYVIKLTYKDTSKDAKLFTDFKSPAALDFLSIYLDNEKIINALNKKLAEYKFKIPQSFSLVAGQKGKEYLNIKGNLRSKMGMGLPKNAFTMK